MQNKENANTSIEEAYRLRRNIILSILIFCVAITGIYAYNQYSKANDLQEKVDKRLAYNKKVDQKNKKIEDENIKLKKTSVYMIPNVHLKSFMINFLCGIHGNNTLII